MANFLMGVATGALRQANTLFDESRAAQYEQDQKYADLVSQTAMNLLQTYPGEEAKAQAATEQYKALEAIHGPTAAKLLLSGGVTLEQITNKEVSIPEDFDTGTDPLRAIQDRQNQTRSAIKTLLTEAGMNPENINKYFESISTPPTQPTQAPPTGQKPLEFRPQVSGENINPMRTNLSKQIDDGIGASAGANFITYDPYGGIRILGDLSGVKLLLDSIAQRELNSRVNTLIQEGKNPQLVDTSNIARAIVSDYRLVYGNEFDKAEAQGSVESEKDAYQAIGDMTEDEFISSAIQIRNELQFINEMPDEAKYLVDAFTQIEIGQGNTTDPRAEAIKTVRKLKPEEYQKFIDLVKAEGFGIPQPESQLNPIFPNLKQ